MPTNLPPEYFDAEERYKAASTPDEKIAALEELISTVPKHKGTDKLRADLRRRLSKLKENAQERKKVSRHTSAFHIEREGAGQVAVIGSANVGKSALVTALTNASPEVADYPFTTWTPTPGMMEVGGAQIQLVDTPPLDREFIEPALLDLIRRADLLLLVVDLQTDPIGQFEANVALLEENRITPRRLQKLQNGKRSFLFKPVLVVVNKNDDMETDEDFEILCELLVGDWTLIPVSAVYGRYLENLKLLIFRQLNLIRVFSKPPNQDPDLTKPFVMKAGSTVEEFAGNVHQDFVKNLKTARIWGSGAFDGQMVGRDHILEDGDVVELRI